MGGLCCDCVCLCRVSSNICYKKQPWSLVKALIEKNTWSGIEEYYRHMGGHTERERDRGTDFDS